MDQDFEKDKLLRVNRPNRCRKVLCHRSTREVSPVPRHRAIQSAVEILPLRRLEIQNVRDLALAVFLRLEDGFDFEPDADSL